MKEISILLIITTFLLSSCNSKDDSTTTLTVASEKRIAMALNLTDALLVKENNENNWSLFYSSIEGFNYQEGYEYVLEVETEKIAQPAQDASSTKYTLIREISKIQKTSENMPPNPFQDYKYIWRGKIKTIGNATSDFTGTIPGKTNIKYVKLEITALYKNSLLIEYIDTNGNKAEKDLAVKDIIHAELIDSPHAQAQIGKEYIFMSKYPHPAHVLEIYMLETDIQYPQ